LPTKYCWIKSENLRRNYQNHSGYIVPYGRTYILEFREAFVQVVDVTLKLSHSGSDKVFMKILL